MLCYTSIYWLRTCDCWLLTVDICILDQTWHILPDWTKLEQTNTSVINDPLSQTHSFASRKHCFCLKFVLFCEKWGRTDRWTDVRTDNMCENNDHYWPWVWVGIVDQLCQYVFFNFTTLTSPRGLKDPFSLVIISLLSFFCRLSLKIQEEQELVNPCCKGFHTMTVGSNFYPNILKYRLS